MSEVTIGHVRGDGATRIGYGRLGVKLVAALEAAGVTVYNDLGPVPEELTGVHFRALERSPHETTPETPTNVAAWIATPAHASWWYEGQHTSIFTMWEATRLPESYRESMHEFDTIVVPSEHNVELFGKYHPNVRLVPLGVDPVDWHYTPRPNVRPHFRFLCGGTGKRKGTDLAHRAFRTVFTNPGRMDPVPTLVMKNPKGEDFYGPNVEMVTGRMTDAAEIALYESCHVYVQPSRGEGFGLQPLQAMAQGMPTILTGAHGHAGFSHLGIPIDSTLEQAEYFIHGDAENWWAPDFEQLCEAMWDTYQNYEHHAKKAKMAARVIARDWTWGASAQAYIKAHDGAFDRPYTGDGTIHLPSQKLYPVIVDRPWDAEIAGVRLHLEPFVKDAEGKDTSERRVYWETAEAKRIGFEAGVLHPDCLTGYSVHKDSNEVWDLGLAQDQAEQIPGYTAAKEYCRTCGQRLNSGVTEADEIYEQMIANAGA